MYVHVCLKYTMHGTCTWRLQAINSPNDFFVFGFSEVFSDGLLPEGLAESLKEVFLVLSSWPPTPEDFGPSSLCPLAEEEKGLVVELSFREVDCLFFWF